MAAPLPPQDGADVLDAATRRVMFSFLPALDKMKARQVCKQWRLELEPKSPLWEPVVAVPASVWDAAGISPGGSGCFDLYRKWCEWDRPRKEWLWLANHSSTREVALRNLKGSTGLMASFFSLSPWETRVGTSASWLGPLLSPSFLEGGGWWQTRTRTPSPHAFRTFFSSTVRENLAGRPREDGDPDSPIHFDALGCPVIHDRVVVMYTPLRLPRSRSAGWDGAQNPTTARAVERAYRILKIYMPNVAVSCPPANEPVKMSKDDTRTSLEPGLYGRKVNQLAADRLPGRAEVPGEACVQIVDPLIWPSKEPGMNGGCDNFCFSTPHGFNENHWIVSPYWWDGLDSKVELVAANIVYSTFQIIGLTVCENHGCLMNNVDCVEESETTESVLMLCPTCFRALQLIGGFDDGKAVLAGLRDFLQGDSATVRSKRELDRLNKWLPNGN